MDLLKYVGKKPVFFVLLATLGMVGLTGCPKQEIVETRRDDLWKLMRQLRSAQEASERQQAAQSIGQMGGRGAKALSALRSALADENPDVRVAVVQALHRIGPKAQGTLIEAAAAKDPVVRKEARRILSFQGGDKLTTLQKALEHPYAKVRWSAAILLGDMENEAAPAVTDLAIALKDQDADVRQAAARALHKIGPRIADPPVIKALGEALLANKEWPQVQFEVAKTLGSFGEKSARASADLISLLGSKEKQAQQAGVNALHQIGVAAIPAMRNALSSAPWQAKIWVARVLRSMGKKASSAIPALVDALADNDLDVRKEVLDAILSFEEMAVSAMPKLLSMLKQPNTPLVLWEKALRCVFAMGTQGTLGLLSLLESGDWMVQRKIMENIGRLGINVGSQAIPFLTQSLTHKQQEVRWTSAMVLSRFGSKASPAVSALTRALQDNDPITRKWAARALGAIGESAKSAIPALQQRKLDPDAEVRSAVQQALSILSRP